MHIEHFLMGSKFFFLNTWAPEEKKKVGGKFFFRGVNKFVIGDPKKRGGGASRTKDGHTDRNSCV